MRCCTIKLKRSWEYCPGCGEEIEWPPTDAQRAANRARHEHRMATDPAYKMRYEEKQLFIKMFYDKAVWDFAGDLPVVQMESNRLASCEAEVLAGRKDVAV